MTTQITIVGRMVADPEISFTPSGKTLAKFRVASSRRIKNSEGEWEDADTTFWPCTAWGPLAEHVGDSMTKGDPVIVQGRASSSSWQTKEGEKRERIEVTAENVGMNLRFGQAQNKAVQQDDSGGIPF